jgi:WD40 repeat protein
MAAWLALVLVVARAPAAAPPAVGLDAFGDPLPAGVVARIGTVRLRHAGTVSALAFSPDDKVLASGGQDGALRLWSTATGKALSVRRAHGAGVLAVAFSRNGKRIASSGGDGKVLVWEAAGGGPPTTLADEGRLGVQASLSFSADGFGVRGCSRWLGTPRKVSTWSVAGGVVRRRFSVPSSSFFQPSFSADGGLLAACDKDQLVHVWDVASGKELLRLPRHQDQVYAAVFSPDGRHLATGGRTAIHLWELATGGLVRKLPSSVTPLLAFSPEGRSLASSSQHDGRVRVWDLRTGKGRRSFGVPGRVDVLAFSHDGKTLAVASGEGVIHLLDFATGKERLAVGKVPAALVPLAFLPGSRLAVGWGQGLAVWEVGKPAPGGRARPVRQLRRVEAGGRPLALSRDGRLALVGHGHQGVSLWDAREGRSCAGSKRAT